MGEVKMESRAAAAVLICIIGHACAVPIQEVVSAANVTSSGNHDNCNPGNTDLTTPTGNVQYFGWWAGSDGHGMGLAYSNLYADMGRIPTSRQAPRLSYRRRAAAPRGVSAIDHRYGC